MNKITSAIFSPFRFVKESYAEIRKVSWPTPRQALKLTIIVAVTSLVFSIFISSIDLLLKTGIEKVAGRETNTQTQNIPTNIPGGEGQ